jgi:hypothetical protein
MRKAGERFLQNPLWSEHTLIQALLLITVPVPERPVNRPATLLDPNSRFEWFYLPRVVYCTLVVESDLVFLPVLLSRLTRKQSHLSSAIHHATKE